MAIKPETQFIIGVHKYVPHFIYRMKNNNPYIGGIPDVWYSGNKADLWVEYKYIERIPQRALILPALTELQLKWLQDRHQEGRNVAVIVGCPEGGAWYDNLAWETSLTNNEFRTQLRSRKELAKHITFLTGDSI